MPSTTTNGRTGHLIAGLGFGLAAGVAFGTLLLAPNLPGSAEGGGAAHRVGAEQRDLERQRDIAVAQRDAADEALASSAAERLAGLLSGRQVLVIATDDADPAAVDGVRRMLGAADAGDSGLLRLGAEFFTADGADDLKSIVTNTLPAGAQLSTDDLAPGTHAGEALASALLTDGEGTPQASKQDRQALLTALGDGGYLRAEGVIEPAEAVLVVAGDGDGDGGVGEGAMPARELANFVQALAADDRTAVLASGYPAAEPSGAVGLLRAAPASEKLTTVDSITRVWAQQAAVEAIAARLEGRAGAWGAAENATAAGPGLAHSGGEDADGTEEETAASEAEETGSEEETGAETAAATATAGEGGEDAAE